MAASLNSNTSKAATVGRSWRLANGKVFVVQVAQRSEMLRRKIAKPQLLKGHGSTRSRCSLIVTDTLPASSIRKAFSYPDEDGVERG